MQERNKRINLWLSIFFASIPLMILCIYSIRIGKNIFLLVPNNSDEIGYWREMYSFSENAFSFKQSAWLGYQKNNFVFGAHGFASLLIYGLYSLLFGWNFNSIIICNFFLLTLSFLFLILVLKPNNKELLFLSLLTLGYIPLIKYLPSSMLEIPCYAFTVAYISLLILYQRNPKSKNIFPLCVFLAILCSIIRINYIALLFPAIMIKCEYKINTKTIIYLIVYMCLFLLIYLSCSKYTSIFPYGIMNEFSSAEGFWNKAYVFIYNFARNVKRMFLFTRDSFPEILQRYFLMNFLVFLLFISFKNKKIHDEELSMFLSLFVIFIANLVTYDVKDWRDYRVLAPLIYCFLIWLIFRKKDMLNIDCKYVYIIWIIISLLCLFVYTKMNKEEKLFLDDCTIISENKKLSELCKTKQIAIPSRCYEKNALDVLTYIPSDFGILIYEDINDLVKYRPEFFLSLEKVYLDNYNMLFSEDNIGYIYQIK